MKTPFAILTMTLLLGIAVSSPTQKQTPKPAPELKKLDYFAGTWIVEGEIKPGSWARAANSQAQTASSGWTVHSS